ncbi:unnamed protein product [marine sediment metagenome]|uniref:Uncharacterized protein n=1 Tax=marine sediment metagenome TaxID=412755 RepID=X1BJV8_9ZZZZ
MYCLGISSRVSLKGKKKHILMMDMDNCNVTRAVDISTKMMAKNRLSDIYIIESSKGKIHLICLDKFQWEELMKIIIPFSDANWIKYRSKSKQLVLRISPKEEKGEKPKLLYIVKGLRKKVKSNAHRMILEKLYNIEIPKDEKYDDNSELRLHIYETGGKG